MIDAAYASLASALKAPVRASGPVSFISDLHLTASTPATTAALERFLRTRARETRTLVILGDSLEHWVGDEELTDPFYRQIANLLAEVAVADTRVLFMYGNRDFLLGKRFLDAAHATLLPDPTVLEADDGQRVVLTHGDALCTRDVAYVRFRHWTHRRWVQRIFLTISLRWRLKIAQKICTESEADRAMLANVAGEPRTAAIMGDVAQEAADALLEASNTSTLIHGHTHRLQLYHEASGERRALSDWNFDQAQSRNSFLKLQDGALAVEQVTA